MRFFSNEAKDNVDDENGERGHTPAEPTVPQQRAGSPWQHDTEPIPQPTAAGTSSAGDVAAIRADDDPERTDRLPDIGDRTVAFEDGATRDRDPHRDHADEVAWPAPAEPAHTPDHDEPVPTVAAQGRTDAYRDDRDPAIDVAIEDHGTFDDPHLTQPIPAHADDAGIVTATTAHDTADDATEKAREAEATADEARQQAEEAEQQAAKAEPEPLIAAAPVPATAPTGAAPFFPSSHTQPLKDRWRDVQLRFVDDPKGATSEAASLVDEAVDKLVQGLREQRGALAKGTDDTESLRVELRSYRDILDRLLGL